MKLEEYLNKNKDGLGTIREIITQYGFDVNVYFFGNNKDICFDFKDTTTGNSIFILRVASHNEALNLMGLIEFLVEEDI